MCLAIPMEIVEMTGPNRAKVDVDGSSLEVDVSLVDEPAIGDFVIVHAGFAIQKLDIAEAEDRLSLFAELASCENDRALH